MRHFIRQRSFGLVAAVAMLVLAGTGAWPASAKARVLIVTSGDLPQYRAPIAAFERRTKRPATLVQLKGTPDVARRRLERAAAEAPVEAVFALGGRAVYLAREVLPSTPLVFAMVLQHQGLDLHGPVTGVEVQLPVESLFARFKMLLPTLHRIGVLYGPTLGPEAIERIRRAAAAVQVELVAARVRHPDEVAGAYRRIRTRIDALWMVPDPVAITRDNFAYLSHRTRNDGIAFLAFSENFVRAGALMSIAPTYETMGEQAAVLLERLLESPGHPPPIQPPLGTRLVVNTEVARALGLDRTATLLGSADELIASEGP